MIVMMPSLQVVTMTRLIFSDAHDNSLSAGTAPSPRKPEATTRSVGGVDVLSPA